MKTSLQSAVGCLLVWFLFMGISMMIFVYGGTISPKEPRYHAMVGLKYFPLIVLAFSSASLLNHKAAGPTWISKALDYLTWFTLAAFIYGFMA